MTKTFKTLAFTTLLFSHLSVVQADWIEKPSASINFNSMIDESQQEKNSLADGLSENLRKRAEQMPTPNQSLEADQKTVSDFVDLELGWGKEPKMVDRRFNSDGDATVVFLN